MHYGDVANFARIAGKMVDCEMVDCGVFYNFISHFYHLISFTISSHFTISLHHLISLTISSHFTIQLADTNKNMELVTWLENQMTVYPNGVLSSLSKAEMIRFNLINKDETDENENETDDKVVVDEENENENEVVDESIYEMVGDKKMKRVNWLRSSILTSYIRAMLKLGKR